MNVVKRLPVLITILTTITCMTACSSNVGNTQSNSKGTENAVNSAKEPLSIQMFAGLYNEVPDMNDAFWTEWQKRTNSKLNMEWVPSGDLDTKLDLLLASAQLPEVLSVPDFKRPSLIGAIKSGAFWDLTPLLGDFSKYPNLKNNVGANAFKYRTVNGKIYSLPGSRSAIDPGIKIREDWLKKLNIPVPTTLDEYADALVKITQGDPDGNGRADTLGLIGGGVIISDGDASFASGFGAMNPTYNNEGGLIYTNLNPQYTDTIAYFRKLYQSGALSKEFAVTKRTQAQDLFTTGRAASYTRSIWWDKEWEDLIKKNGQPDAKILNLTLKGPKAYAVNLTIGGTGSFLISKKVPEAKVIQLLDYFEKTASTEMTDLAYYGIEGVHHTVIDGQKVLNEKGVKEVNTTSKNAGVLATMKWGKVISASGDKAYNDAKIAEVKNFDEIGSVDPFNYLNSDIWNELWAKRQDEWKSMVTKAIVGQITMEEYQKYVDTINNLPEAKKAYAEFATQYKAIKP
ncbi:ABC transporter substrate-binding protein [Paenibacillus sp. CGMCC 1.16610]|uniref:ABC transporter substrate-binding protein n=1 Tax=Paenibacillus anseongense TaxID=2682845 RepID=A0ABW9U7W9_9BACL|nr:MULTISPECIES: ABC transporter substrate-binding protein [Paenibacillus]MBA2938956.1 ABC transporter substrate-binding protein [Paenibacillus sp. CGMCC 1.16610]MVQ34918.1 ABC transporter substrate-binding protein [Paenibacillus anseongense]